VFGVEHEFITSIYARDPDGNLVEWTYRTRALTEADRRGAEEMIGRPDHAEIHDYPLQIFKPAVDVR
jgi:hypothetical protein